jgi:hypothetical protein
MSFGERWRTLIEECEELPPAATFVAPLTDAPFQVTDSQDHRIVVEFRDGGESRPLNREQFEALHTRIRESPDGFPLDNLPPGAEPYAAVLSLHPRYEVDEQAGTIAETDDSTATQLADGEPDDGTERTEPDVAVYADALLLIDALERIDPAAVEAVDTSALVNLYTLLSEVQRDADDLRGTVGDVLLDRIHHDQPVHGQYGSVQRTSRRRRDLKDDETVLDALAEAGIEPERVLDIDREKVEQALNVTDLQESAVYEIDEREYVRKAEVNEDEKESRLQGLTDRLALSDDPEAEHLREEVAALEARIEELTEFRSGREYSRS